MPKSLKEICFTSDGISGEQRQMASNLEHLLGVIWMVWKRLARAREEKDQQRVLHSLSVMVSTKNSSTMASIISCGRSETEVGVLSLEDI